MLLAPVGVNGGSASRTPFKSNMTRLLAISLLVLLNFNLVSPGFAGTNTTVILSGVTIPPAITEGDLVTLTGNIGDLALSQNDRFLNHLFLILLGRSIDPAELDAFGQSLAQGTSRQQIASMVLDSPEYRARVVQETYARYLRRDADPGALSSFAADLARGSTRTQLAASIIGSSEYYETRAHGANNEFVNAVYQDLLNRPIDLAALNELMMALNGGTTRAELAAQILASAEYRERFGQDTYRAVLHRAANLAELRSWLNMPADGTMDDVLTAALAGSQEFLSVVPKTSYRITVDWRDGVVETVEIQPPVPQNIFFPFQLTHRYLDNMPKGSEPKPINVSVTLHAETGIATALTQSFVKNAAPQLRNVAIPTPSGVGTIALLSGDILDPGVLDAFTLLVDWGDGNGAQTVELQPGSTSFRLTHVYLSGGNLQPNVSVKDDDGAFASQSLSLFVTPFVLREAIPSQPILLSTDDSGVAPNDAITRMTSALHYSGTARPGNRVDLFANGQLVGFSTADNSGQWSILAAAQLFDGTYQVTARATDSANNVSLPSQPLILVLDTKPPLAPSIPDLLASSDSGVSSSDNITTAAIRTFVGTTEPGALVELMSGTNLIGIANVDFAGQWRIDESHLGPGTHSFSARVKDRAGNVSPFSSALTVTIGGELTPPSVPTLVPESDLGWSNTDLITSQAKPTFVGTAEPKAAIQILANDRVVGSGMADAMGRWRVTTLLALAEGNHSLTARLVDEAGNTSSASPALTLTIDITPPAAPSIPILIGSSAIGTSNLGVVANAATPAFRGHAETDSLVELLVNGAPSGSGRATGGSWTIPVNAPLGGGTYDVSARAVDLAGNQSPASAILAVTIHIPEVRLTLTRVQNTLLLSWPSSAEGYFLEASDSLKNRAWLRVDKPPTVEGDAKIVILSGGLAPKFYRLNKQ